MAQSAKSEASSPEHISPAYADARETLLPTIRRTMVDAGLPGLSIALVDGDATVWKEGFGYADRERGIHAEAGTVYRVGSIAKVFTATVAMQLAAEGALEIDAPVKDYVPSFSIKARFDDTRPVTIRDLLTHHGGLPCDLTAGMWSQRPFTAVASELGHEYAAYPPGTIQSYSNVGYDLLGHAVQNVSGERFADHIRTRLLAPLGMHRTGFASQPEDVPGFARGYRDGRPGGLMPMRDLPAMGMYTSADDLARFMGMVLNDGRYGGRRLLETHDLNEMLAVQNSDTALDVGVKTGLGWSLDGPPLTLFGPVARHGGRTPLFAAELMLLPDRQLGVAVLSNSGEGSRAVRRLAATILAEAIAVKTGSRPQRRIPAPVHSVDSNRNPVPVTGDYATHFGILTITGEAGGAVHARTLGKTFHIIPYTDGWFGIGGEPSPGLTLNRLRFSHRRIGGRDVLVAGQQGHYRVIGERVELGPPSGPWLERRGRYRVVNADPAYPVEGVRLMERDGILYLQYEMPRVTDRPTRMAVTPVTEDEAVILGLGRARGETVRFGADGSLHYSGLRAVKE